MARHAGLAAGGHRPIGPLLPTAFSLPELLVVLAIVATLAVLLAPAMNHALLYARITQARHDLRQVQMALWNYYLNHQALPPTRKYCLTAKRHLDYGLPPELWEGHYLDGPLYDVFSPEQTYRYSAIGPYSFNDSPPGGVLRYYVPADFPRSSGQIAGHIDVAKAPVRCVVWSAGPGGPPYQVCYSLDGVRAENPVWWYPERANGLLCYYWDGSDWHFSF
jgi:prepilin-type N-terminal cleavage/methylation domain-containing protein